MHHTAQHRTIASSSTPLSAHTHTQYLVRHTPTLINKDCRRRTQPGNAYVCMHTNLKQDSLADSVTREPGHVHHRETERRLIQALFGELGHGPLASYGVRH